MRLLILGGTVFLGRALTDAAIATGHVVTHLNRGKSALPDARVETLVGDRTAGLEALANRTWDAVIDTSGYLPQVVRRSVEALRTAVGRYIFVSSISAYTGDGFGEDSPVYPPLEPVPDTQTPETYDALKSMCEAVVRDGFGDRALIVRPGLIVGPHDPTDRFTWWPARIARGGRVAAPGRPQRTVQFVDVRDLAEWIVKVTFEGEQRRGRTSFNATGPATPIAMGTLLETSREVTGSDAALEWIDEAFLAGAGVQPWKEMPLWLPETDPKSGGFMNVSIARALATGLAFRPLAQTIADMLAWERTRPRDREWKAGLSPERETALLAAWDSALR